MGRERLPAGAPDDVNQYGIRRRGSWRRCNVGHESIGQG
ncbi:hypothetical protein MMMB2_4030 [Mycobacterium marinum MB2]|nr:hypothetical protein MMMB2_4030 [Mycobacterium marinum MB2]